MDKQLAVFNYQQFGQTIVGNSCHCCLLPKEFSLRLRPALIYTYKHKCLEHKLHIWSIKYQELGYSFNDSSLPTMYTVFAGTQKDSLQGECPALVQLDLFVLCMQKVS